MCSVGQVSCSSVQRPPTAHRHRLPLSAIHEKELKQFGRKTSEFQIVQSKLTDVHILVDQARLLTFRVAAGETAGAADRDD
jgi:alkylation response protein AidB-like acyl-CoA dehydrogenase